MITVTLGEAKTQKKDFPKLMRNTETGLIYYFHRKGVGLPLQEADRFDEDKKWASSWNMDYFTDYNEPITIQNQ